MDLTKMHILPSSEIVEFYILPVTVTRGLKAVYLAPTEDAVPQAPETFRGVWEPRYPQELHKVIYATIPLNR